MNWEKITCGDFKRSVEATGGVCLVPVGCLEKHGNHLPLGTDIAIARAVAERASLIEPFMVFPYYPFGFVSEVRHKAGTVSLSFELQHRILEQLCGEIARNGFRKIVFGNGHGGNSHSLRAFAQSQLDRRCDYVVYVTDLWGLTPAQQETLSRKHGFPTVNMHGDRVETSCLMALAPGDVHMERCVPGEGDSLNRLSALENQGIFTALNWYGSFPQQLAGDPSGASAAYGADILDCNALNLVAAIREIKKTDLPARLLAEFQDAAEQPGV